MCGIVGLVGAPASSGPLEAMVATLRHRGPDGQGTWRGDGVALGHTRLSIIDLAGSPQPMASPGGRWVIVFNGEILNYRELRERIAGWSWRSDGDTEVLLAAWARWGPACLPMLRGQFSFAVHDSETGETFLARDPMGILPLCWADVDGGTAFGSEQKAVVAAMAQRPGVDPDALHEYLGTRAVRAPRTLLQGVHKIRPGHVMRLTRDGVRRESPYGALPDETTARVSPTEAVDLVHDALLTSVRRNLVADVPVGAYLSGGVDSSLVVALVGAARQGVRTETFAAGFGDVRHDELPFARTVSEHLGTRHHEVLVDPASFDDECARLSAFRDAPLSEPADVAVHLLARTAREHVKVVLSGEGSDELFGGYPKHRFAVVTELAGLVPGSVRTPLLDAVERRLPLSQNRARIAARALAGRSLPERLDGWFAPFTVAERDRLMGRGANAAGRVSARHGVHGLEMMLRHDQTGWLPDNLLERGDRMSMAASLELRPPFLDLDVVALARRLPASAKVRHGTGKWVVKEVARRYLPTSIVDRPKVGFRVPLDAWFREGLSAAVRDLVAPDSFVAGLLDVHEVRAVADAHLSGRRNEESRLWTLLSLERWGETLRENRGTCSHATEAQA